MLARVLRVLLVVYALVTAIHIGFVVAHEPFAYDAWNLAIDTRAEPFSLDRFIEYGTGQYLTSNPRVGQWLTYLAYKLEWFAVIATPVATLALALAVAVLGLGRWPAWRRGRELALVAIAIGSLWLALPHFGMLAFCRAYAANYVYAAAIQLWLLVPLRLGLAERPARLPALALYFLGGVIAGACNEHTGPTLALGMLAYAWVRQRTTGVRPGLAWAGALGAVVGFAAIFFAPGQGSRYDGLADRVGLLQRLLQRGVTGNLDIFRDYLTSALPALALLAVMLVVSRGDRVTDAQAAARRRALGLVGGALAAGALVTATLFVSPKLGWRFYLAPCALLLAALLAVADHALVTARRLAPLALLAVAASVYAGVKTIPLYARLADASAARLAGLAAAPRGSVHTAESLGQLGATWWFLGDDLAFPNKRELVAGYFGLAGLTFRAVDPEATLAVTDVRVVPRAVGAAGAGACDDLGGFALAEGRGIDVRAVHHAARTAVALLAERCAAAGRALPALELAVRFTGAPPAGLPARPLLLARWGAGRYTGYAARIDRGGVGTTRTVRLPPELAGTDHEIFAYQVGSEARRLGTARDRLQYRPWRAPGAYWILACEPAGGPCFVIAAARLL